MRGVATAEGSSAAAMAEELVAASGAALVAEPAAASGAASAAVRVEASAWASAACWALASEALLAVELDLETSGARSAAA